MDEAGLRAAPDFDGVEFELGDFALAPFPEFGRSPRAAVVPGWLSPRAAVVPGSSDGCGRAAGRRRPGPDGDAGRRDEGT
ncbi:hypothetical protein [Myceligenerans xiligouense]|uniref:hypothetical protein n=1 Tax=Myceligenerans xiligouense TaxID=253184 RepID=UPI00147687AB|nr:hypothetical protein [Myceligenerans xiligouense]